MAAETNQPVSFRLNDSFWNPIRETVRRQGIPYQWKALNDLLPDTEPSYCMRNFRIAAGQEKGEHGGWYFQDSDVGKWLEGAAYTLRWHPDPELEKTIDSAVDQIVAAQQPDGYLDTFYIIGGLEKRWTNLRDHHELYIAGHLLEGAVAYYQVTGKRKLLDAMIRFVAHIDSVLGPEEEGKLPGYPGHPEIELALMKLYRVTGDPAHLRLAKYFVDQRGQTPLFFAEETRRNGNPDFWKKSVLGLRYYQAAEPVRQQRHAEGHAVRAMYLYSGMADVARATGDNELAEACRRLWQSATRRRMYITGGVGSSEFGEAFTFDDDLPNDTVYAETCASIGLIFLARRMLNLEPGGEYADVMERALYNGVLSGMQLDGTRFFYVNPLEVRPDACAEDQRKQHVKPVRQKWFGCACCPPNIIRLVSSLEDYVLTATEDEVYVHLYIGGEAAFTIRDLPLKLAVETEYPRQGQVRLRLSGATGPAGHRFALKLRLPGWCRACRVTINDHEVETVAENGYITLNRPWKDGDTVLLDLAMPVMLVRANPRVWEDAGRVAVCRGPLVYCLEEADNGPDLHLVRLGGVKPEDFQVTWQPDKLGGIMELTCPGLRETGENWDDTLYSETLPVETGPVTLTFIPYATWANREMGEMRVWIRE